MQKNFWKNKTLDQLSREEWEALCDRCARCCLEKLEDDDTGEVFYTRVACKILDLDSCRCRHYSRRHEYVPECLPVDLKNLRMFAWLPATCAYRLLFEGRELPAWHHLVCGSRQEVHKQGISVRQLALPQEEGMDLEDYIIADSELLP